jgi:hypothetical protein
MATHLATLSNDTIVNICFKERGLVGWNEQVGLQLFGYSI